MRDSMRRWAGLALLLVPLLVPTAVLPSEIQRANHLWQDDDRLLARLDLSMDLPEVLIDALANGVGLDFRVEVRLERQRGVFTDRLVASAARRVRLEYYALSRHYLVTDLDQGRVELAPTLGDGLEMLARRLGRVVLDVEPGTMVPGLGYSLAGRVLLDQAALPLPLQWDARLRGAYMTRLGWYRWPLE
jgi:hypothetical protein